ncbi:hypothetical protein [Pontibacter sp. SGAir0037]|uniref:hypothetical protein n=1 Tax=Pontibacter sp. SGAir0037 TaxID=2571030 RepID=UPI0010CD00F1|nr:hypothetical protein [Pontibacter sp. SGAir0037]QCR21916.1 hypothetical protein C1N53_05910 [Pontibacter sp. SGAir0037]
MKKLLTVKSFIIGIGIILIDLAVYIFFGLLLMNYDDFYDESKGEYWSWESMSGFDKAVVSGIHVWNFINVMGVCYLAYKAIKKVKQRATIE